MKIIFLDVDGVLNSYGNILAWNRFPHPNYHEPQSSPYDKVPNDSHGPESELDQIKLGMIRRLAKLTGANIVLCSNWRFHVDAIDFGKRHNLPIIDATSRHREKSHGIIQWVQSAPYLKEFVVIDDSDIFRGFDHPEFEKYREAHVRTTLLDGFTFTDFVNSFLILMPEVEPFEVAKKSRRLEEISDGLSVGRYVRTPEEIKADREEYEKLSKTMDLGEWAVGIAMLSASGELQD